MAKIILIGTGGDGVKLLGQTIGSYLITLGFNLTLIFSYDSAIRGGDIMAFLKFKHEKIENPMIDVADLVVQFSNSSKNFKCKKLIVSDKVTKFATNHKNIAKLPLQNNNPANMLMFGFLIKELGLEFAEKKITKVLPSKFTGLNLRAIKLGYKELQ